MVDAQGHIKIIDFNLSKQIIDCKYNNTNTNAFKQLIYNNNYNSN